MVDCENLTDLQLRDKLLENDNEAWTYVLNKLIAREKKCSANNQKRLDWNVDIWDLLSRLYEEMVAHEKLRNFHGTARKSQESLIAWLQIYLKGYLNQETPGLIECPIDDDTEDWKLTWEEILSDELSEKARRNPYIGEDLRVLRNERLLIASHCFAELWKKNSIQAYVMLLKVQFHMSSLEIMKRLGISSPDNVDKLFSRAVADMKAMKEKYEN